MKPKRLFAWVVLAMLSASSLQAAVIPGRWEKVDALTPGADIVVRLRSGDRMVCVFKSSSSQDLTVLREDGSETRLPKSEIHTVESYEEDSNTNGTWIGLGIGLGVGGAVGEGVNRAFDTTAGSAFPPLGMGVGALVGYLVDKSRTRVEVLYMAP